MLLSELIKKEECIGTLPENIEIGRPTAIPAEVRDGDLYIILKNLKNAYKPPRGKPSAVVLGDAVELPEGIPAVRVREPRRVTATIFARFFGVENTKMRIVGVTGTAGKSSTATMLERILSFAGHRVGFIGTGRISVAGRTVNEKYYSMTTPDPWLLYRSLAEMERCDCDTVVMEISSHSLALSKVAAIGFEVGVFTNLSPEHLDFHRDMEDYFSAKRKLAELTKKMIWNIDDGYARRGISECGGIGVGILWRGDYWLSDVEDLGLLGSKYIFHGSGFSFTQDLPLGGCFNVYNAALATAAAIELGVRPCIAKECLRSLSAIDGRYEVINGDVTVIIDYAHTATAFENLLKSINSHKNIKQKLISVFGAGGERDRGKRPEMGRIAEKYSDLSVLTDDNPRGEDPEKIISEIAAGFVGERYRVVRDRRKAITEAILLAEDGDTVAVIGKGAERYAIDGAGYHDFDERAVISEALELRARKRGLICE